MILFAIMFNRIKVTSPDTIMTLENKHYILVNFALKSPSFKRKKISFKMLWVSRLSVSNLLYQFSSHRFDQSAQASWARSRQPHRLRMHCFIDWRVLNTKKALHFCKAFCFNGIVATTYFTRFDPSIIGGSGLNFSVRDGKR